MSVYSRANKTASKHDEEYWAQVQEEIKAGEYFNRTPYTAVEHKRLARGINKLRHLIERKERLRVRQIP